MNKLFIPQTFTFQWHITERCNWHCKHCYQGEQVAADLSLQELFSIFNQFLFLIKKWQIPPQRVFLNITGGEPFLRKDIFQFLDKVGKYSYLYQWGILTNGSLLNENSLKKLKELDINYIQVSLEGTERNNDKVRGAGSFNRTIETIKMLDRAGIFARVSLTLNKQNIKDVKSLVILLDRLGTECLGVRRFIPWGRGRELGRSLLQPRTLQKFYSQMKELDRKLTQDKKKISVVLGCESGIFSEDLSDAPMNLKPSWCGVTAGRIIAVMADGEVFPCRRLPITIGNLLQSSLEDIYYSEKMSAFRNLDNIHFLCKRCPNFLKCFGGARCVTYTYANQLNVPDVQCWRAYKKLNEPLF